MYKNVANFHRLLPTSTVQSTERVKIFPQKFFALKVGLGREELQGVRVTTLTTLNTDYIISQIVVFQYPHLYYLFTHYFKNTISHLDLGSSQC